MELLVDLNVFAQLRTEDAEPLRTERLVSEGNVLRLDLELSGLKDGANEWCCWTDYSAVFRFR